MIAEKGSFRAAVSAAIFAFGISAGAIFCPVTAFGLQADSWALLLVCIAASIAFAVLFRVFRPVYSFGAVLLAALAFAWFCHDAFLESALGLLGGIFENYVAAFHFSMPQAGRGGGNRGGRDDGAWRSGGDTGAYHGVDGAVTMQRVWRGACKRAVPDHLPCHPANRARDASDAYAHRHVDASHPDAEAAL